MQSTKRLGISHWCMAIACAVGSSLAVAFAQQAACCPPVKLERNDAEGILRVLIEGKEAIVYRYSPQLDLPHYWPVRSPSGKIMTVQYPNPYPHHRSFWFADKVRLAGQREVNFYGAWYTGADPKNPRPPFRDHIRHLEFLPLGGTDVEPIVGAKLVWEMDFDRPVLDEVRQMRIVSLGGGEYFLDMTFKVTASYGDVEFVSDWIHYAWPYIRMAPEFSVEAGGRIVNSRGQVNQEETNGQPADWVDYSNTVDGVTEGLAIFSHPSNPRPHKWLTRNYGCFGPRRTDDKSGKRFWLRKGESLTTRVGILVHRGDHKTGQVAARYRMYAEGNL